MNQIRLLLLGISTILLGLPSFFRHPRLPRHRRDYYDPWLIFSLAGASGRKGGEISHA